jgi:hypothetical protein
MPNFMILRQAGKGCFWLDITKVGLYAQRQSIFNIPIIKA